MRRKKNQTIDAPWLHDIISGKIKAEDVAPVAVKVKRRTFDRETGLPKIYFDTQIVYKSGRDAIAHAIITGNERMISKILDKIVATKTDITSAGDQIGGFIYYPEKENDSQAIKKDLTT